MSRIKLEMPDRFIYETDIPVRITDLNYGAHLGNDAVLGMMHEARLRFFKYLGFGDERSGFDGHGIIMSDSAIQYKAEGFYGDILRISVALADISRFGFDVMYRIARKDTDKEVALGKTGIVHFDYQERKAIPMSRKLITQLESKLS